MRFKRVRCPAIRFRDGIVPDARTLLAGGYEGQFDLCPEEIMVFFKNIAICPVHGIIPTGEPWTEGNGGKS